MKNALIPTSGGRNIGVFTGIAFAFGAIVGFIGSAVVSDVTACPVGADGTAFGLIVLPILSLAALAAFPLIFCLVIAIVPRLGIALSRPDATLVWLLSFTAGLASGVAADPLRCAHQTFAQLRDIVAIRIEGQEAVVVVHDRARVQNIVHFFNARSTGWAPAPEFSTPVRLTFLDREKNTQAIAAFGVGGITRFTEPEAWSVLLTQDSDANARFLCNTFGQPLTGIICGDSSLFGIEMQSSQNRELVAKCAAERRSLDPSLDSCAKLVFARGNFDRPTINLWRQPIFDSDAGPYRTYGMTFPSFEVNDFCGSVTLNADGSIALRAERNRRLCPNCPCFATTTPTTQLKRIYRRYGFTIEPENDGVDVSKIAVPVRDPIPNKLFIPDR